jgi:N utilization substance protein B
VSEKEQPRVGTRRKARQCALQVLYQFDGKPPEGGTSGLSTALGLFWSHTDPESAQQPDIVQFTELIVHGVFDHLSEVDAAVQKATHNWRLERMGRVDRNILRLATFELLFVESVPMQVAINESIELAKEFGTEDSFAFVNGILDRLAQGLHRSN